MTILDGKALAEKIKLQLRERVSRLEKKPRLAVLLVGEDPASKTYVEGKRKDCEQVGIEFELHHFPSQASREEIGREIDKLNSDERVTGIIIQLPLPPHLSTLQLISRIDPRKDVDGLHPLNVGRLWLGDYDFERDLLPCTPKGIIRLLDHYSIKLEGKMAVIVNRSNLVGKPLAKLMLDRNATVLICHSKTPDLARKMAEADILVTAVGRRPSFVVGPEMVKEGAVVVDVGMNFIGGRLVGDVDFERVSQKASYITPVPGGVGPMTRAMLLENVVRVAEREQGRT
ncbi:MAG: bifunctional 5,10-methylenetetrahydrofolate dehydrogenase/5,10-methenyltetrahydrofolate cyclohydrolase [Candidatus Hadarchaeales archaeon]